MFRSLFVCSLALIAPVSAADYAVIISKATAKDNAWREVAIKLVEKHKAGLVVFDQSPEELKQRLCGKDAPRWICWVARPQELGALPVAQMHRLARGLDDDPYMDCRWGIITGRDASVAAKVVAEEKPLVIRNVGGGTSFAADCVERGQWFSEFKAGEFWVKEPSGKAVMKQGEADSTASIVKFLNEGKPDCFLTSGHATEHDWQPGYKYRNGVFGHRDGVLLGKALDGTEHAVNSPNPKVYLAIGNCLMGNIPATNDCMALAWIGSGGARQMVGYTVPTWFGYAGWGVLDYFIEQPGRFTLQEAWMANQHALVRRLGLLKPEMPQENPKPGSTTGTGEAAGLLHDRDVTVFYGDPKWEARMAPGPLCWKETLIENPPGEFKWTITPQVGKDTFAPVDTNGSQRGGRPLVLLLPRRFDSIELLEGDAWKPMPGDDFIILPNPGAEIAPPEKIVIRFRGK